MYIPEMILVIRLSLKLNNFLRWRKLNTSLYPLVKALNKLIYSRRDLFLITFKRYFSWTWFEMANVKRHKKKLTQIADLTRKLNIFWLYESAIIWTTYSVLGNKFKPSIIHSWAKLKGQACFYYNGIIAYFRKDRHNK